MKHAIFFLVLSSIVFNLSAQAPTTWKGKGIGGGGALFSPSINPDNPDEMYVGCDMGGLYHSMNHGASWLLLPFQQIRGGHYSKVNFTNNNLIRYAINYKSGLDDIVTPAKTLDGGVTWTKLIGNPDDYEMLYALYANYNNPNQVMINWYNQIYFSNDGGTNFNLVYTGANNGAGCKLSGVYWDGNTIYCGTNDGIVRSTNGGTSFSLWTTTGLASGEVISSFSASKEGNTLRFYALSSSVGDVYNGDDFDYYEYGKHVYRMDNASGNWTNITNNFDYTSAYVKCIKTAMNDIDTAYLSGETSNGEPMVLRSVNAGGQWNDFFQTGMNLNIKTAYCGDGGDLGWSWAELLFGMDVCPKNASKLLITDYGFIHQSSNGMDWQQCYTDTVYQHNSNQYTPTHQLYKSAGDLNQISVWQIHWNDQNNLWQCSSDIKGTRSSDGGQTWSFNFIGHTENTSYRIVKNTSNATMYMATSSVHDLYQSTRLANAQLDATSNTGAIKYSSNQGATWQVLHDFSDIVCWVTTDPNNANTLYASVVNSTNGNGGIWKTTNANLGAASTWTHLSAPPRTEGHPFNLIVLNDGKLLATYSGHRNPGFTASSGVFLYDPSTNSWADRSDAGMFYWTQDVLVDPNDSSQNTWYACVYEGWGVAAATGVGGLYKTTNRGISWVKIWSNERCMSASISPQNPNEMYVTTEYDGLQFSDNLNSSAPIFTQTNYPFRSPMRVFFNPYNTNEVWVSSFGQGLMVGSNITTWMNHSQDKNLSFTYYPNPVKDELNIQSVSDDNGLITVYSLLGEILGQYNVVSSLTTISMQTLPPGIYLVNIQQHGKEVTWQVVKE